MRKLGILGIVGVLALFLAGCGGGDGPGTAVIQSTSDQPADGDIGFTPPGTFLISQANVTRSVQYGIDPGGTEFQAFLDFPLDGSTGGGVVPLGAVIVSADIEFFVNNLTFASFVPTVMDLVTFPITGLTTGDFNSVPLATRAPFDILSSDINNLVRIDITSLMVEAQRLGLRDLQVRFLIETLGATGVVQIDDDLEATAPILTVEYR
ncbi:MAG: hypothetical protein ACXW4G_12180 [Candidatus Deferrimicrobiaceae bacterium]